MKVIIGSALVLMLAVVCLQAPAVSKQALDHRSRVAAPDNSSAAAASEAGRRRPVTEVRSPHRAIRAYFNKIYDGPYYHHFRMETSNWSECFRACMADSRCRAWSMVKGPPGCEAEGPLCWLKNAVSVPRDNVCAISGRK